MKIADSFPISRSYLQFYFSVRLSPTPDTYGMLSCGVSNNNRKPGPRGQKG